MIASSFPEASIVLFGPLFEGRRRELDQLRERRANVHYLGSIPYERLGAYTGSMDVCMIPLQMNELMRMADPNKIYEYAAVEKPIVTFRFSEDMDDLAGMIYLAGTRAEFVGKIRAALESGADRARLREYAMRCSWRARSEAMVALIRSAAATSGR
jgi:hypothetical protein